MPRRDDPAQLGLFAPPPEPGAERGPRAEPDPRLGEKAHSRRDLPDSAARERIERDLDTNLLVEAGAGSGKTTALVRRMVALVGTGTATVEEIAAVTFTRKAAAELRERFQAELERELPRARDRGEPGRVERLDRALRDIDRAFIGTIHSFCARLLRERPVEAGLDPGFREMLGAEEVRLRRGFWRAHLERIAAADDPLLADLSAVGLAPSRLEGLFDELVANPDVEFLGPPAEAPAEEDIARVRQALESLLDRANAILPPTEPEKGWDKLQGRVRLLGYLRRVRDWRDTVTFLDDLSEQVHGRSGQATQYKWTDGPAAKALSEEWDRLRHGRVEELLDRWWAHRYPVAIRFAERAARQFARERRRSGRLNFQDLLILAADLLREHAAAREELGRRFRRVLVDEFQDTDPVQAEVLMLLASPPDSLTWREVVPRPGALFVVGDPKQSIYRFRRADISIYNLVRERFAEFGDVLGLVANFRSGPPIAALVQGTFDREGGFPPEATPYQTAFAPLRTRAAREPDDHVACYEIEGGNRDDLAVDGASRLAPWIREQISGGRRPEEFLVLSRWRASLAPYARALEAWGVPVQVTGAGIDAEEELRELMLLLEALEDPGDPVKTLAVLTGLFFGIDHETLVAWALEEDRPPGARGDARRTFDFSRADPHDPSPVGAALRDLKDWWQLARREPADIVVGRIVEQLGLVPFAAAAELGGLRSGGLVFALDALRTAALQGDTSIPAALDALRTALESEEAEAALEPARGGAVRVMTLHQAKGLEAPIVVLVHPAGGGPKAPRRHIERRADGSAAGWLVVQEQQGRTTRVHARPAGWAERADEEQRYDEAEQTRLLYVAVTRAGRTLLVERRAGREDDSPWAGIHPWLDADRDAERLRLDRREPPAPERLERTAAELTMAIEDLERARSARARPGYEVVTVTRLAHAPAVPGSAPESPVPVPTVGAEPAPTGAAEPGLRGPAWGSAVHGALDAAARGATGERLRAICRSILLEEERPLRDGEPRELDELLQLVRSVIGSPLWARARASDRLLSEVPFALHSPAAGRAAGEGAGGDGVPRILEGVIDLAFRETDGWVIADYKTDVVSGAELAARRDAYRRQVEQYAEAWTALTGEPVKERVLYFTARPEPERLETW